MAALPNPVAFGRDFARIFTAYRPGQTLKSVVAHLKTQPRTLPDNPTVAFAILAAELSEGEIYRRIIRSALIAHLYLGVTIGLIALQLASTYLPAFSLCLPDLVGSLFSLEWPWRHPSAVCFRGGLGIAPIAGAGPFAALFIRTAHGNWQLRQRRLGTGKEWVYGRDRWPRC